MNSPPVNSELDESPFGIWVGEVEKELEKLIKEDEDIASVLEKGEEWLGLVKDSGFPTQGKKKERKKECRSLFCFFPMSERFDFRNL